MPPVSPQGSRGGLITAVVVFTIGFVLSTILAIYYGVALSKEDDLYKTANDRMRSYIQDTSNAHVVHLMQSKDTNPKLREHTLVAAAMQESEDLSDAIVGKDATTVADPTAAIDKATAAVAAASAKLNNLNLPPDLVGAIGALADYAASQQQQADAATKAQSAAAADAAQQIAHAEELLQKAEGDVAHANELKQQALDAIQAADVGYETKLTNYGQTIEKQTTEFNEELKKYENEINTKDSKITDLKNQLDQAIAKLEKRRVPVEDPMVRRTAGQIQYVASDDIVYINLGMGDHIMPGMTFEVYDQDEGIPKLGDGMSDDNMPTGIGSIEVERVQADSSQCRVVALQPTKHISNGDLIANLIYDRNVKFNFFVYGKFDLAHTGHPTDGDRDKVLALIDRWGGQIQKKINVDTDFVVMGAEPVVEDFTDEQLQDPFYVRRKLDEEADQKAYDDTLDKAHEYHIPVMNQNRFLYFIGYYDTAQR
jgi:hypothetical protein